MASAVALAVSAWAAAAGTAHADPDLCTDHVDGVVFPGSLIVPAGAKCFLAGVTVNGDVMVEPGAFLQTLDGTTIQGSILGNHASVQVTGTKVGGAVLVTEPVGYEFTVAATGETVLSIPSEVCGSSVGGSVVLADAPGQPESLGDGNAVGRGGSCTFRGGGNSIGGDLLVVDNRSVRGLASQHLVVGDNRVGGAIACAGNDPAPTGGGDVTGGGTVGQCEGV